MEDINHKSLEDVAVAESAAVLSTETVSWDSIGVSSKNIIPSEGQCSEEHVLKCTFKACDPEQTGEVSVFRIIEYLQEMTGQSCEDWRFQSLYKRLDPEERGAAVDFSTFHLVMKDWITDCRQDGLGEGCPLSEEWEKELEANETADLTNSIKDLQHGNKQLAMQNIKLQRTIEAAEELNAKLSEEISELKGKLKGTQQALEQARVMANELEDLKVLSKSLEEENTKLHAQARQLEKEQQFFSVQVDNLQEENKKLLLQKESSKCKIKQLFAEKTKIKSQLCEYENLLSCKDTALNEKVKRTEELTVTLDEYQMVVQELKLEVSRLQDQLCQSYKDLEVLPRASLENANACLQAPAQTLCMEIEETQKQEFGEEAGLPSPLCGMLPSLLIHPVALGEFKALEEELEPGRSGADITKALLQRTRSLSHLRLATDVKISLKKNAAIKNSLNQECSHQKHLTSEVMGSMEEQMQSSLASENIGSRMQVNPKSGQMRTGLSNMETQAACTPSPEVTTFISAEPSPEAASQEHTLVPVYGELIPSGGKKPYNWFEILIHRFLDIPLDYLLLYILQKLVFPGLLVACISLLAIFYFILPYNRYPVWFEPKETPWPHLQLRYLQPPPI